jgi:hypothetical protein
MTLVSSPAGRELGLAGPAGPVPVPATAVRVSVEDVRGPFRRDPDRVQRRTIVALYLVPAGLICSAVRGTLVLAVLNRPLVSRAEHLVILRPGPRFRQLGPRPSSGAARPVVIRLPLGPGVTRPVLVRPV